MPYLSPGLPEVFQCPACQVITGPAGHDDDNLATLLQTGQHCVCEPDPVFLLGQLVVGLLSILDEVIDNEQRSTKAGGCAGRGRGQVVVVSALQAPEIHGAITVLDGYTWEYVGEYNPVLVCFLLLNVVSNVFAEHGGKSLVVGAGHDFLRLVVAQHPLNQ